LVIILELNSSAGKHGVGIIDHVEDRIVGLKSREVYECPAATCILKAHKDLEKLTSTIHENKVKPVIDGLWADYAYNGLWFDPLMTDLNAFIDSVNCKVSGEVKLKLFKGNARVIARKSENALYDVNLATYEEGSTFNQASSSGFIELWSLQTVTANKVIK
jgi:argininosuccinate synthase